MELKSGYKWTAIGVIPLDWKTASLSSLTDSKRPISYGIVQTGPSVQNGVRCLRVLDVDDGRIKTDGLITTTKAISDAYKRTSLKTGDLVMPLRGKVGDVALVGREVTGCNLTRGLALIAIRPEADACFFKHSISSVSSRGRLGRSMNGSALQEMPIATLRAFEVAFPIRKVEQELIAEALNDADALIESLEQLIAKKRQIKQGAMQELLLPRSEWCTKKLGDVATLKARIGWQGLTTAEYLDSGDYYLVTGTEFKDGYVDWINCHFVDEPRYKQDKYIQLKRGDVLVTKDGTIGKVALVVDLDKPATLNSGVFVIRPFEEEFHPEFFYYLLCSSLFTKFLGQLSAGSTINHLYQKDFISFVFKAPASVEDQRVIATILRDMDVEVAGLEIRLSKTRKLKQGMMQTLLTGAIRLPLEVAA